MLVVALAAGGGGGGEAAVAPTDPAGSASIPHWRDATAELGLDFRCSSGATGAWRLPEIMTGGAGVLDADGDGALDLILVDGEGDHLLALQRAGRLVDASAGSGLHDNAPGTAMGLAVGDVNEDGVPDVYLTRHGPDRLLLGRGDGTFEDATDRLGVDVPGWSCSAAFADYDLDGDLDLYVTRYVEFDEERVCGGLSGRRDYCGPKEFPPAPDVLLRNDGEAGFRDVSRESGIAAVACAGLGVVWRDIDGDGLPDAYVANDAYPNQLWRNLGDGTFEDVAMDRGLALNMDGRPEAGMGIAAGDFDQDGRTDLFVTHLRAESNTLYRDLGDGRGFVDATGASRLGPPSLARTGFGVVALDVELDGDLDLFVANGRVARGEPLSGAAGEEPWNGYAEPNLAFLNGGAGRFAPDATSSAAFTAPVEVSRGLARGDLDGDGDEDLVLVNLEGPARVLLNEAPRDGGWIALRCRVAPGGRDALGARVTLVLPDGTRRSREVARAGSYLSSSSPRVHLGLPPDTGTVAVEVAWPGGATERFSGLAPERLHELWPGAGAPLPAER